MSISAVIEPSGNDETLELPEGEGDEAVEGAATEAVPEPAEVEVSESLEGADALKETLAETNSTAGTIIEQLDAFGFTMADTRFSLWTVLVVVLVIVGVFVFGRIANSIARGAIHRMSRLTASQQLLSDKLATVVIWGIAVMVGIDLLGIDLTAFAVFSGAFGLAIGFGLQKTFGNLIAGIILLMDRSIKPGDVIAVSDMSGRESFGQIRKIGIRAISVVTRDRKEYIIPNENLMVNQVENWSYSSRDVRVKIPIGVAYNSDLDLVSDLLMEAVLDAPRVLKKPDPRILLMGFGDSSVDFEIRFWIDDPEDGLGSVRSGVLKRVWRLFQANGIEIPFPQRDLNLRGSEEFSQLVAAISQRMNEGDPKDTSKKAAVLPNDG